MTTHSHLNIWDRQPAVLYLIRARHPLTGRTVRAYVGKTTQRPWTKRIDQHLWGRGQYRNPAQPWADTVLGYRSDGSVREVISADGVRILREGRWSPFGLWWREILAIWLLRPRYNYQWNRANRHRITMSQAKRQRTYRNRFGMSENGFARGLRVLHGLWLAFALSVVVGVLLIPGVSDAAMQGMQWAWHNPFSLLLLVTCTAWATRVPRRTVRRRRR